MLVKFHFNAFYGKYIHKGETADVTDEQAKNLVEQGRAEYAEAPAETEADAPKPAPKKRKTTDLL